MDNYQILRLRPGLSASANEKPVELAGEAVVQIADEAGTLLARLQARHTPEQLVTVDLPAHGFHIIYTGSSTLIMVSYLPVIMTQFPPGFSYVASAFMNYFFSAMLSLDDLHYKCLFISYFLWLSCMSIL
jgi:hypothetical protein